MDEQEKIEEYNIRKERVVRWDAYRINQFSYTNNLLLGLNLAFLVFFITQAGFKLNSDCGLVTLQLIAIVFLLTSFCAGLYVVYNRLLDFRKTAKLTKKRKKEFEYKHKIKTHTDTNVNFCEIQNLVVETRKLGKRTWCLLQWQMCTFLFGTIVGIVALLIENNS